MTPTKRKLSPEAQRDTPSPKQNKTEKHRFSSPTFGSRDVLQKGRGQTPSRLKQRNKTTGKGRGQKVEKGQVLITDMIKDTNTPSKVEEQ